MATVATQLNSGTGFSSGETVTASKLNNLVNTATVTGIVNTDIDNDAAIAASKLELTGAITDAQLATGAVTGAAGGGKLAASAVTGQTVITDPLADTDEFLVHDASASALRKVAYSSIAPTVTAAKLDGVAKDGSGADIAAGTAPIFGCRAWVNFDGTTADNLAGTYARTGTDVTVTITAHGVLVGHKVRLDFTLGTPTAAADGLYTVTVVDDANNFHVTTAATGTSSGGTVALLRRAIRASGNVASVTYHNENGTYTVNFSTALPDENYALAGFANFNSGSAAGLVTGNNTHAPTALACDVRVANSTSGGELNVSHVNVMFIR
jgi:hypothetical protein